MKNLSPKPDFLSFNFSDPTLSAIKHVGYLCPTKVQLKSIPFILEGKDILVRADTGSGKTAAFVLPLLEKLTNHNKPYADDRFNGIDRVGSNAVQILILVPTRELAIQVADFVVQIAKQLVPRLKCQSVYGGVKINPQMMALRSGVDLLVATPGRLLDLVEQNAIKFNQVKALVIDEVDRLMKGDFQEEIDHILKLLPDNRQNLMFTATFPDSIKPIVRKVLNQPEVINIDELCEQVVIEQRVITVNQDKKNDLLTHLIKQYDWSQVLIFCSAKRTCDNLVLKLKKRGITAIAMHSNKEQSARFGILRDFKAGKIKILIATDVAARGLDVEQLPCVINFDLPRSSNDYMHRIGRTGRAGQAGMAISLIAHHEYHHFSIIEKHNKLCLQREQLEGFEADEIAPPLTESNKKPKAKNKTKLSKKKRALKTVAEESKKSTVNAHIWGKL